MGRGRRDVRPGRGWRRPRYHRTATALLLTLVAVAVPCGAWFYAGSRGVERRARLERDAVTTRAYKKGVSLAERLATRLEVLREAESLRPFYHYQNLLHDPKAAAEGVYVSVSPLAEGPMDSLIEAHFQVDDTGVLTLPTLNDDFPDLGLHSSQGAQCSLFGELKDIIFFCTMESAAATVTYRRRDVASADGGAMNAGLAADPPTIEVLDAEDWHQHLEANALYADLKFGRKIRGLRGGETRSGERVEVKLWPFVWYTLPVGGEPGLVALRGLETPAGVWTQGFVISQETVAQYLESSPFPAVFAPRPPSRRAPPEGELRIDVDGTPWEIVLDLSESLAATATGAAEERGRFLRLFLLGTAAAGLAGLLVVTMLYQSERLSQQRARFAASAAHELRTPLAGLRLYGEMLVEGLGNPSRAREYARRMAGEAERLGRVVTNVLSFTHLERDSFSVHSAPGDLARAVGETVERLRPALEESGAELEVELADDLPPVEFDRDAVTHILQNLLDNAEKYTRDVADRRIAVRLARRNGELALSVADNGRGIAPALRRRLFSAFARGRHPDAPEGLGLGLVLVRELARAQGGDVRYGEAPAGGAMFTVSFPA